MKILKYLFLAALPLWITSCLKDKGNYDYTEVNTITIDSIKESYNCIGGVDTLKINPDLSSTLNPSANEYVFSWYICEGVHKHTEIGTELNLNYKVTLSAGTYKLYLEITDKSEGLKWLTYTTLNVATYNTRGFLVWGEKQDGYARLDMITMAPDRDTLYAENVFDNSELGLMHPTKMIFTNANFSNFKHLFLMTENRDIISTSGSYFEYQNDFANADILMTEFEHTKPIRIREFFPRENGQPTSRVRMNRGYITDDLIFIGAPAYADLFTTPINRYSTNSQKFFKPYPKAFVRGYAAYNVDPIFYDMDEDCFVVPNNSYVSATFCKKLNDYPGDPFPWNNKALGRSLVYGENGFESLDGYCYAIMKDTEGRFYIYAFQTQASYRYPPFKINAAEIDLAKAQGFADASHYTVSSARTVIIYAVGSSLRAYDFARGYYYEQDLGQEITHLELGVADEGFSQTAFWVATYDSATGTGVLKRMDVSTDNNSLELIERPREIWPVTMKVVDVEWKNANDNALEIKEEE